ncbi:MAG: sugar phosphate isomerase/epimerase [Deferribacteres bacterium]|nr:sugar phosphate isomerase/epimerase [Deferribacteres bacterium]
MRLLTHVTYGYLVKNAEKLAERKVDLEVYFSAKVIDALDVEGLRSLISDLKKSGIGFNIHAPFFDLNLGSIEPFVRRATVNRFKSLLPVIEAVEPYNVVVHTGFEPVKYRNHIDEWVKNAVRSLSVIRKMIPQGVTISVENVFDEDPYVLEMLLSHFDSDVGHCFDIGHFHVFSKTSLSEWLERLGDRIIEMHIHNNDGLEDRHWEVARGSAPVVSLLKWAKNRDVAYLTLEPHTEREALRSIEYVKKLLFEEVVEDGL